MIWLSMLCAGIIGGVGASIGLTLNCWQTWVMLIALGVNNFAQQTIGENRKK